jgi:hypothetical protein
LLANASATLEELSGVLAGIINIANLQSARKRTWSGSKMF